MRNWSHTKFIAHVGGAAAIEFAIIGALLAFLVIGVADFSGGFIAKMQVGNAARAGAEYALANGWDQTAIQAAITNATSWQSISANPAPSQFCGCPNGTGGIASATCGSSCSGSGSAGTYVTSNATANYSTLFAWPGLQQNYTFNSSLTVRIK